MQIIKGQIYIVGEQEGLQSRGRSVKMMLLQLQQRFGNQLPDVDVGAISTGESQVAHFRRHCATLDLKDLKSQGLWLRQPDNPLQLLCALRVNICCKAHLAAVTATSCSVCLPLRGKANMFMGQTLHQLGRIRQGIECRTA